MRRRFWAIARHLLFQFEPETVHRWIVILLRLGIYLGHRPLRILSGAPLPVLEKSSPKVHDLRFLSRVGLAAGFDKDAEFLVALPDLGFGFAEIGTVTPRPQPGNDRPRLFREPSHRAIFNRMGFNGLGATVVSQRLRNARPFLPEGFQVGVNIGKNKDTPLESAARDYVLAVQAFDGLADYIVINVSSPNTPGLRSLQTIEGLKPIIGGVRDQMASWQTTPPLFLKLAPEISGDALIDLIQKVEALGIDGWVLSNTLSGQFRQGGKEYAGGWSGAPLSVESRLRLKEARSATAKPIISVGGIMDVQEARLRFELGADLIQVYSGWIYGGPSFPAEIAQGVKT